MKNSKLSAVIVLGAAALGGCSAGAASGHSVCKDGASTQRYSLKWQDDIADASHSGKLSVDQVVDAQGKAYEKLSLLKTEEWSAFCQHLDAVRDDAGF
jgi:hypothetical protein